MHSQQFMMMVPMMMDGSGASVPMMNPYMPQASMAPAYCPMPTITMGAPVAAAPATAATTAAQGSVQAPAAPPAAAAPSSSGRQQEAVGVMMAAAHGQAQLSHQPQAQYQPTYPYMMPAPMAGGGYMMPMPAHHMAMSPGQQMGMMAHPHSMQMAFQNQHQEIQNGRQEQKDSSPVLHGGSGNLAHCA
jgi:hypothetical protein